jgi:hypothetical protein
MLNFGEGRQHIAVRQEDLNPLLDRVEQGAPAASQAHALLKALERRFKGELAALELTHDLL